MLGEPIVVVARIASVFDQLGIRYAIGGSLASSMYGIPRSTQDVDIVAAVFPVHIAALAEALQSDFYVDVGMIRDALAQREAFNVIHLPTMFKADIFPSSQDPWSKEEMARALVHSVDSAEGKSQLRFASPEDVVLHKLVWYRMGGNVSERQWGDVLGVLQVQQTSLDFDYLANWANYLGVADLLRQARTDAEIKE